MDSRPRYCDAEAIFRTIDTEQASFGAQFHHSGSIFCIDLDYHKWYQPYLVINILTLGLSIGWLKG